MEGLGSVPEGTISILRIELAGQGRRKSVVFCRILTRICAITLCWSIIKPMLNLVNGWKGVLGGEA